LKKVRWSSLEKSVYLQVIDFQKNHTELKGYAEAWTTVIMWSCPLCEVNVAGI